MKVICFDLDDTLYKEIDFLKSAFKEIVSYALNQSHNVDLTHAEVFTGMLKAYFSHEDAFDYLINISDVKIEKSTLISIYRNHIPEIILSDGATELLNEISKRGYVIGIITDGRSLQQRNKIRALGLETIVQEKNIIISEELGSEKPCRANYEYFVENYQDADEFFYIADNVRKDFLTPNAMGWKTICLLDDGQNIHKEDMGLHESYLPNMTVSSLREVIDMI